MKKVESGVRVFEVSSLVDAAIAKATKSLAVSRCSRKCRRVVVWSGAVTQ